MNLLNKIDLALNHLAQNQEFLLFQNIKTKLKEINHLIYYLLKIMNILKENPQ